MSNIEWTQQTLNPFVGCSKVSPGKVNFVPEALDELFARKKPTIWFVNSMSDVFHPDIQFEWIDQLMSAIALNPHHIFQILTKRPEKMVEYFKYLEQTYDVDCSLMRWVNYYRSKYPKLKLGNIGIPNLSTSPLSNLWLGVSVENNQQLGRLEYLNDTPAKVRFISFEPLLERIDEDELNEYLCIEEHHSCMATGDGSGIITHYPINWVIIGGESHQSPKQARPFHLEWAESLIEQCQENGVKVFFKQAGSNPYYQEKPLELKNKKGGDLSELPEFCQVREMPLIKE